MTGAMLSGVILLADRAIENGSGQSCHEGSDWQRNAIQEMASATPRLSVRDHRFAGSSAGTAS
jgi:hypothetical protein